MSKRKQTHIAIEKIEEQDKYIEMVHRINEDNFNRTGKKKSYVLTTFGCPIVLVDTIIN